MRPAGAVFLLLVTAAVSSTYAAESQDDQGLALFDQKIRPVLERSCYQCHSVRAFQQRKLEAGLLLDSREGIRQGGESGPAVVPGDVEESLIVGALRHETFEMPPDKKLPDEVIADFVKWIELGAPDPRDGGLPAELAERGDRELRERAKNWWAYQPRTRPPVPKVTRKGWDQNPIDAFVLQRIEAAGLSPNPPAEKVALLRRAYYDLIGLPPSPDEVDTFLADDSPEAYAKVIDRLLAAPQYGEKWGRHWLDLVRYADSVGYERDNDNNQAWPYRDYVIRALNDDKPFNKFIIEQLAGNQLPGDQKSSETQTAADFERLGLKDDEPPDPLLAYYDGLDDVVSTTGQVFLAMTIGCARCHEHKIDPMPQADYYRLMAFFHTREPDLSRNAKYKLAAEGQTKNDGNMYVLLRGNPRAKGRMVLPGYPSVVAGGEPADLGGANKRLTLASWIASPDNPLTARVIANRLWQFHFGRGIVDTPNDFGGAGSRPTHPLLLDWLASELIDRGWRLKSMHRLIMLSATYRMSSAGNKAALAKDPQNGLLWRYDLRRLTAEEIRDSMLWAAGVLNEKMFGPPVYIPLPPEVLATASNAGARWGKSPPEESRRRTIYVKVKRSLRPPLLTNFDAADTDSSCPVRFVSTVPTQALGMLNSREVNERAAEFARRLIRDAPDSPADRVQLALRLTTGRPPTGEEIAADVKFLDELQTEEALTAERALECYCLTLLNTNEFIYLD
jgi:hypothetical protein